MWFHTDTLFSFLANFPMADWSAVGNLVRIIERLGGIENGNKI